MIKLVTGGVRSGKSAFAEDLVLQLEVALLRADKPNIGKVAYIATLSAGDEEMEERITRHQQRRPAHWRLIEAASELPQPADFSDGSVLLLDCLSGWISNRLLTIDPADRGQSALETASVLREWEAWLQAAHEKQIEAVIVSSESGWGGVAMSPLGRIYQDVLGEANQIAAAHAQEVYAVLSGIPWRIKG